VTQFLQQGSTKRLKKAQNNGLWGVEIKLLRIIEGKMLAMLVFWKLGYEDTLLHGDTLISVRGYKIRP
jgi:hypothetical protein